MRKHLLVCGLAVFVASSSFGQWVTQKISLQPGWNAVYIEVQPEPRACDAIFTNLPVESVWKWDRRFSTIQYTVDPDTLLPESPDWLVWLPPWDPQYFLSRLYMLQGGQAYLIKVATNAAPFELAIKGRAMVPLAEWYPHSLNLIGFPICSNNAPMMSAFFRFTPQVDTSRGSLNELYRVDAGGKGVRIVLPAKEKMQEGRAYWIQCASDPKFLSQINVQPPGGAVDFGLEAQTSDLLIQNVSTSGAVTVVVRQRASETPPATGNWPELAGPVALSHLSKNESNAWVWASFPSGGITRELAPLEKWTLRLGIRRNDMPNYTPVGTNGAQYQSVLDVSDSAQSLLICVPVLAEKGGLSLGDPSPYDEHEGLWVGAVNLNHINAPAYSGTNLLATGAPATLRLIVHVDGTGTARLLQHAVLAWDATATNAPHTNGAFVVYANEADVPADAENVARVSAVTLPLMDPLPLSGSITNLLTCTVTNLYSDPVNPFVHRYHPQFDNKDADFQPYDGPVETYSISRNISMDFTTATNAANGDPFWGSDVLGGTYREELVGLRAQSLFVEGTFFLQRISRMDELK